MRRFMLATGISCAILLTHHVGAQNSNSTTSAGGTSTATTTTSSSPMMPGQVIGSYRGQVFPIGTKLPSAAPPVGQPIAGTTFQRPYDPKHPYDSLQGTNFDPKQVLAPLSGPDGKPVQMPDQLDLISERIREFFIHHPPPPRPPYAPGIARRARERIQALWRYD
jgi:hypothetical protein